MADNPKPTIPRIAYQPTHFGFDRYPCGSKLGLWDDVGHIITYETVVQTQDQSHRLYTDLAYIVVASRVRTPDDASLSGV